MHEIKKINRGHMGTGTTFSLIGTTFLFLTALIHIKKGYPRLQNAIKTKKINLPSFSASTRETMSHQELNIMWLSFGIHLIIIAGLISFLSLETTLNTKNTIIVLGTLPIIDSALLKAYIKGVHLGAPLLALSGFLIIIGQFI